MTPKLAVAVFCLFLSQCSHQDATLSGGTGSQPLTVIAIGDIGKAGPELRANASLLTNMYTGQHDGGKYDAMLFLGDNFYNTGLNLPAEDVDGFVKKILGPFKVPFDGLGRRNVHAVAGNHDYYSRNAIETSVLFGLINIAEGPIGLTDRGNKRAEALSAWTYYWHMPSEVVYPIGGMSTDSVQFIFIDSALPLRTDPATWSGPLDSLRRILTSSMQRSGIVWRVFALHHPFYSVGAHGGYTEWNDETNTVEYLTQCDKDSNALAWLKNSLDPEDLCTLKYQEFLDSLKHSIIVTGANIQLTLAGHDHSLQLLYYPDRDPEGCPKVHVISGAGAKPSRVKLPQPPSEYTSAQRNPAKQGISVPGFVQLTFERERLRIVFFDAGSLAPMDMGGGKKEFRVSSDGHLIGE